MSPNAKQLTEVSELIDAGKLKVVVHKVWALEEAGYVILFLHSLITKVPCLQFFWDLSPIYARSSCILTK